MKIQHEPELELPEHAVARVEAANAFAADRRSFLQMLGMSLTLASGGCLAPPTETIVPHVRAPEYTVPGKPRFYATALTRGGYATGVLVESHEGRPTKIEGNPDHPASLGATDAAMQAALLSLYDPDRSQAITHRGEIHTWDDLVRELRAKVQQLTREGHGLRVLTESVTSPTLADQLQRLLQKYPRAKWHQYEPVNREQVYQGTQLAFGASLEPRYLLGEARVILAFDADFLNSGPGCLRYARHFMQRRVAAVQPHAGAAAAPDATNRLYVVEPIPTCTGSIADHRLPLSAQEVTAAAHYVARAIAGSTDAASNSRLSPEVKHWLDIAIADLRRAGAEGLIIAGDFLPAKAQAAIHATNAALGCIGRTIEFTQPILADSSSQYSSLIELSRALDAGEVELLLILGGNPAYASPAELNFGMAIQRAALAVHLSLENNETSQSCHWQLPAAHELEAWGDARSFDGSVTIQQPLIQPLYYGKTAHELIDVLLSDAPHTAHELIRDFWREELGEDDSQSRWHDALWRGVVVKTSLPPVSVRISSELHSDDDAVERDSTESLELVLRPDPFIYDGRWANNAWLQELPRPITSLTWNNAATMSPSLARRLNVTDEDLIELDDGQRSVVLPVLVQPGHADGCVSAHLGYGRQHGGRVCSGVGVDLFRLLPASGSLVVPIQVRQVKGRKPLALAQSHHRMEGRNLVRTSTVEGLSDHAHSPGASHTDNTSFFAEPPLPSTANDYAWGMSINLTACIGCQACVAACQAENNIPVVGPHDVRMGREMHWLRVDTYVEPQSGDESRVTMLHQPVPCMHCENAPCEVVCPVAATVHSSEGLNDMVYNRCVGTRYCSNNCPYKVRRFNFLQYADDQTPVLELLRNPNVSVRSRGVMEKCTYCVQRISAARSAARQERRRIRDGDVVTACQAVCPTAAIVFGDIADPRSRVSQAKSQPGDYALLAELNTRPRTTYLPRTSNPNPNSTPSEESS